TDLLRLCDLLQAHTDTQLNPSGPCRCRTHQMASLEVICGKRDFDKRIAQAVDVNLKLGTYSLFSLPSPKDTGRSLHGIAGAQTGTIGHEIAQYFDRLVPVHRAEVADIDAVLSGLLWMRAKTPDTGA